ncbi:MAG: TIGR03618 family F420-dependent PPOX class oxidoreductase [Candidatus Binatia bacterium]|nr:TIGR03618 family F420-dependent PPOX class oxidoreductase [Candidatus Binatia bacterium]
MHRRKQIEMTEEERAQFLAHARTAAFSTIDPWGYPHTVAMWFAMEGDCPVMTTYAKSQKARNVERNPKVAFMAESGQTYDTLKGVLIRGEAELVREPEYTLAVLKRIHEKMLGALVPGVEEAMRRQAQKRVVVRIRPVRISSWDHSKLGGLY